jgi:class 3 adenylate cyclase
MRKETLGLLGLFLVIALNIYSQPKVNIDDSKEPDTASVNAMLQESKDLLKTDIGKAISKATEAGEVADKISYPQGKALALKNIGIGYFRQGNYLETLNNWFESLAIFESIDDQTGIANLLNNIAAVYNIQGDDAKSLEYSLRSLKISEKLGDKLRILSALNTIANVYNSKPATKDTALGYLLRALPLCEEIGDKDSYGIIAENIGEIYYDKKDDVKALEYFNKSIKALGNTGTSPFAYNGIAKLYLRKGNTDEALKYNNIALDIAQKTGGKIHIMQSLFEIANVYVKKNDLSTALDYYNRSEVMAKELGSKTDLQKLYEKMSETYQKIGDYNKAYSYQKELGSIKDSLFNENTEKKLGALQFEFDLEKKQNEINLLTKDKNLQIVQTKRQKFAKNAFMIGLFLAFIIALLIFRSYREKVKTHKIVDKQKNEIEHLLLNVLPKEVARELQVTGHATPRHYDSVSVMFTDFKGFTLLTDHMSPEELVAELDACFNVFDEIIEKNNLEKIKTIGDSYMCAGGIPTPDQLHVLRIVKAGLEIQDYVSQFNERRQEKGFEPWYVRIGIHVGPVVAGVVGKKKYAYDIWGSTVNIASRMESNGEPGKVNISSAAYELVKDYYQCKYRGKISAKNIGEIDMYFIEHEYTIPKTLLVKESEEVQQ